MAFDIDNSTYKFILPEGEVKEIYVNDQKLDWMPLLDTPSISLSNNILSVTKPSPYATDYGVFVNNVFQATFSTPTYDISSLTYQAGNNAIGVKAIADGHRNSFESNVVSVTAYNVIYDIIDGTAQGTSAVLKGQSGQGTITPGEDFLLPQTIEISGATLTSYNDETGVFTFVNATGEVEVYAECIPMQTFSIVTSLTNCTADEDNPDTIFLGRTATLVFYFDGTIYRCPDDVYVDGANYTWTQNDVTQGTLVLSQPYDDVEVGVNGVLRVYSIIVTTIDCTADANNPTTINGGGTATLYFNFTSSYPCPTSSPTVYGASSVWTKIDDTRGRMVLSSPFDNVRFTVKGANWPTISFSLSASGDGSDFTLFHIYNNWIYSGGKYIIAGNEIRDDQGSSTSGSLSPSEYMVGSGRITIKVEPRGTIRSWGNVILSSNVSEVYREIVGPTISDATIFLQVAKSASSSAIINIQGIQVGR